MIGISWRGLGWLVPVIIIGTNYICYNLPGTEAHKDTMFIVGMLFSAFLLWILGNYLNFGDIPPLVVDGERRRLHRESGRPAEHRFYYFRMEYWAILPVGILL